MINKKCNGYRYAHDEKYYHDYVVDSVLGFVCHGMFPFVVGCKVISPVWNGRGLYTSVHTPRVCYSIQNHRTDHTYD